jgi:hypothetical protein
MAEKSVVFSLKVNTGNSVQDIQAMDAAVNDLNNSTDQVNQSTKDVNKTFEQVYGELQPLTARMGEAEDRLYELALAGQQASQEYKDLLATVANYRKTQIATDLVVDQAASTMSQKLNGAVELTAGVFQGLQSAVALTGVENEKLTETMVRLQAVQGVVSSVMIIQEQLRQKNIISTTILNGLDKAKQFILTGSIAPTLANTAATTAQAGANVGLATATTASTTAMKLFRLALISTGIGAIVVAIGLLITNFDKVSDAVMKAYNWFNKLGPGIKLTISIMFPFIGVIYGVIKALEYFGVVDDEQTAKMKANAKAKTDATEKEMNKKISAEKKKAKAVDDAYALEIRKAQAAGKNTEEMEEKKLVAALKSGRAILEMQKQKIAAYEDEIKLLKATGDADSDRAKQLEKSLKEVKKNSNDQYKENKKLKDDLDVLRIEETKAEEDAAKERADKAKARAEKRREAAKKEAERLAELERKANEERIKAEDEQFQLSLQLMKEGQEKELFESTIKYDKMRDQAHGNAELLNQIAVQEAAERIAIVNKYNKIELDKIAENEAKKRELRNKIIRFTNNERENELLDLEEWYKEQEALNLKAFQAGAIDEEEFYDAGLKAQEEYRKKKAELDKKYDEQTKANEIKAREESLKGVTQAIEGAQRGLDELKKVNELVNQIDQARLNNIAKNRDEDLANLDKNLQAQLSQEGLTADQKAQIEQNFAQQKYQIELKAFNEEEKIKKAQFARDKALRLAQVGIDTASAIVKGIAQFGPPPSPAGIAAIASASLIGITQAMAIMNQKYQAGSAPTPPQLSSGGGGALSGAGASSFTANTQAQTTDLNQLGQGQQGQTMTSQVVVLESDITNTQNKVQLQEAKSSF